MKTKTYDRLTVCRHKANSTEAKKILSHRFAPALPPRKLADIAGEQVRIPFKYDGRIGRYLIYKAHCPDGRHYYVATISNGK